VSGGMWKAIETKAGKIRMGKTEERMKEMRRERAEKKKLRKERTMEVKKVAETEEWEIWDEEEKVKQLVPERFHKWIHVFGKKTSERIPTRKL